MWPSPAQCESAKACLLMGDGVGVVCHDAILRHGLVATPIRRTRVTRRLE